MTVHMIEQAQALTQALLHAWNVASGNAIAGRATWAQAEKLQATSLRAQLRVNRRAYKVRAGL